MATDTHDEVDVDDGATGSSITPWITLAARVALAGVLFWAGWAKFTEPPALQRLAVEAYQLLPESLVGAVGYGLPVLEIVLAVMLLAGFATRFSAAIAGILMVVFIGGIISAWARGLTIDCGCFGGGGQVEAGQTKYLQEILRDIGFLALAVWIFIFPKGRLAVDRLLGI